LIKNRASNSVSSATCVSNGQLSLYNYPETWLPGTSPRVDFWGRLGTPGPTSLLVKNYNGKDKSMASMKVSVREEECTIRSCD
jgi:hypothetical protein